MEILMGIKEDVAYSRAQLDEMHSDIGNMKGEIKSHQDRIRRLELIVLPTTVVLAYIGNLIVM